LFNHKDYLLQSKASIPIKLIVTDDYEVANQITKATNRQTEVKVEAFESLEPYHRKLKNTTTLIQNQIGFITQEK
jgi:hypothetical protein